jgi:hypothetical protein
MTRDDLLAVRDKLVAAGRALGANTHADLGYCIEQAATLFSMAKWLVGAHVELCLTPRIDEKHAWGWLGAKHFLIEGARASVVEVRFADGAFSYELLFDDESWFTFDGQCRRTPPHDRVRFTMPEAWLRSTTVLG